ncbi:hypothetical protein BU26DRAFT_582662 [Trematosphaeria pertusa]|uniref:Uncharacterized protein n=1 Tax=Trematosphaeria pertusa TaxID=390896 RepID=A0A6A6IV96_9PLEO|nr:uncharacterized protein BU26DRAFT_582662 [Trematosphaeria pertusa]KAF2254158.1 hypothetical protein BU26DRAFT_582662 [Trematosphaeria pertusa]
MLRRVLAKRSIAADFDKYNPTKLQEIVETHSFTISKSRKGSIREFARKRFPESCEETARDAVLNRLKFLALESMTITYGEIAVCLDLLDPALETLASRIYPWMENAQRYYDAQGPRYSVTAMIRPLARAASMPAGAPPRKRQRALPDTTERQITPDAEAVGWTPATTENATSVRQNGDVHISLGLEMFARVVQRNMKTQKFLVDKH